MIISAAELRAKQDKYLQEVEDSELSGIIAILEKAYTQDNSYVYVRSISRRNIKKLEDVGYTIQYTCGDCVSPGEYTISW